jgi:putative ABC transport system substrate-binding protein
MRFLALALLGISVAAHAQDAKPRRIGLLMPSTQAATANLVAAFEAGLRERGYVKGQNLAIDYRYSEGKAERIARLARELAESGAEVIVTTTDPVVRAVQKEVRAIPVVMVNTSDPVGAGLVQSLAKPGGSVTGLTNFSPEISAKRLELLKEAVPGLSRVAYLWNPDLPAAAAVYRDIESAAGKLGLRVASAEARSAEDIDRALAALGQGPELALLVQAPNPVLYTRRQQIARRAGEQRLPSMFNRREYVSAGGLMSYGPDVPEMYRRAAHFIDAILAGAKPGDLPVEQPSRFELTINAGAARSLGIQVPRTLLLRADHVFD